MLASRQVVSDSAGGEQVSDPFDANRRAINQARLRHSTVSFAHGKENDNPNAARPLHTLEAASLLLIGDDPIEFAYYVAENSDDPNHRASLYGLGSLGVLMGEATMRVPFGEDEHPGNVRYLWWRNARELSLTGAIGLVPGLDGRGVADRPRTAALAVTFAETGEVVELPFGPSSGTSLRLTFDELLQVMGWIRAATA